MTKSKSKTNNTDTYSHPLVRDVYDVMKESGGVVLPTYMPIIPNNSDRISSRIIRQTEMQGLNNTVDILMSAKLFGNTVDMLPVVEKIDECGYCRTKMNGLTVVQNHAQMRCNLCNRTTHINYADYQQIWAYHGYRIIEQSVNKQQQQQSHQSKRRRVLFVIQASQYNYQFSIHSSLFNCLNAIKAENIEIGIILFDDKCVMFVNPTTIQLTKVIMQSNEVEMQWNALPVEQDSLFIDIDRCQLGELEQLVNEILYSGYLIKQTIIKQVSSMLNKYVTNDVEINYFVTTFNSLTSNNHKLEQCESVFNQKHNTMQQILSKKLPFMSQLQAVSQPILQQFNAANFKYYVVAVNTSYRQSIDRCKYNLVKIYTSKDNNIQNQLYYDLYHNIAEPTYKNVQITIRTSHNIELQWDDSLTSTLYGNISIKKLTVTIKMNQYSVNIRQANQKFTLPLHFIYKHIHINNHNNYTQQPFIQLQYKNTKNSQTVVLNLKPRVQLGQNWLQSVDDQLVFNHHMRSCLSAWNNTGSYKQLKDSLLDKYYRTVRLFKQHNGSSHIVFPKNWKHYLLYSFILQQKIIQNTVSPYEVYKLINSNLQCLSKYLYYRVYKLEDGLIKNIKFTKTVFDKYEILFVQNGDMLFLVMRDPPVAEVKNIFGYFDSTASLANQHHQLPILQSNQIYRNAVQKIRELHQSNFLPLKILDYQVNNFIGWIDSNCYQKQKHLSFLRRIWREA